MRFDITRTTFVERVGDYDILRYAQDTFYAYAVYNRWSGWILPRLNLEAARTVANRLNGTLTVV